MTLRWTAKHVDALLKAPHKLVNQPAWSWVQDHGGLETVYQRLQRLPLPDRERDVLVLLLSHPGQPVAFYEERLNIHYTTYHDRRNKLTQIIASYLNGGVV